MKHAYLGVFFTSSDRASTIPSNISGCQSGTWSKRVTKVNGSHHGDNPLSNTQNNGDPARDKTLARSNRLRTSEAYPR